VVSAPAPEPAEGEALIHTTYVGIDAAARTWLNDQPGYLPPVQIGEVIRAAGIGEVVASRCDAYAVGDIVTDTDLFPGVRNLPRRHLHDAGARAPGQRRPARGDVGVRPDGRDGLLRDGRHR